MLKKPIKYTWAWLEEISPVKFFVVTAAVFGLLFLIITPPFQSPDEPAHFYRAYQVSEGIFIVQKNGEKVCGNLPVSLESTTNTIGVSGLIFQPTAKYDLHKTKQALYIKENLNKKKFYDFSGTAYYPAISYAPQAAGILMARIINAPPVIMMYAAKLLVLCTWIVFLAFAIKFMPHKKWALVAVGLLPMAIFQATSLSADVMAYGLLALTFALILKFTNDNKYLKPKQLLGLLLLLIALALSKQIMFVFLLLVLLLPGGVFKNTKDEYLKKAALVFIPIVLFGGWMAAVHNISITTNAVFHPVPQEQTKFILSHPFGYLHVLFNTYFFTNSDLIARSFIGDFGWLDTPVSEFFAVAGYVSLAFLFMASYEPRKVWLKTRQKYLIALLWIAYFLGVTTAIYIYYDPVRDWVVEGVQGRYLIPLAIILIPLLYGKWLRTSRLIYRRIAIIAPVALLVISTVTIYCRYYVHMTG